LAGRRRSGRRDRGRRPSRVMTPGTPAPDQPLAATDAHAESLIRDRFDELMRVWPGLASYLGIHAYDGELPDMSRGALEGQTARERRFLADLDALDPTALSPRVAFERDLAVHQARRRLFD